MSQARSQVFTFGGKNKLLGGNIFVFVICSKQIFLSQENLGQCPPLGYGPESRYEKGERSLVYRTICPGFAQIKATSEQK